MDQLLWIITALAVTLVVECGLSLIFRSRQLTYAVFLGNLLTNPALNLIMILYGSFVGASGYLIVLSILEVVAVGVEALVFRLMTQTVWLRAIGLSLLFNASSFLVGVILFW